MLRGADSRFNCMAFGTILRALLEPLSRDGSAQLQLYRGSPGIARVIGGLDRHPHAIGGGVAELLRLKRKAIEKFSRAGQVHLVREQAPISQADRLKFIN